MDIEKQVTSLELSKRLKELGVEQESLFWWVNYDYPLGVRDDLWNVQGNHVGYKEYYSAFTVAELGEMLPEGIRSSKYQRKWICKKGHTRNTYYEYADTEADARAKMLIYLLENKLI